MENIKVMLVPLSADHRERFILDNQRAFKYGALEEFGKRDEHLDGDGEIISRRTIEECIDDPASEAYRIVAEGRTVGGTVISIDRETCRNHLELLFVSPQEHGRGIGYAAWQAIEALHPETKVWETFTPYFEKRNIHFYINKCGFCAAEFFCDFHAGPDEPDASESEGPSEMFRFIKVMEPSGGSGN